ncbi:MAG: ABC-F family ATP-binding cassette domain-containing protein [Thermoguttaceae bacterium]
MEVILTAQQLRRHFAADPVLVDTSFQIRAGDKIGLVGPNGCGKTTLMNILASREESEKGSIEKASDISIGYLEQHPEVVAGRTILDEAKLALAPLIAMQHEAEEIAHKLAVVTDELDHRRLAARYDHIHESLLRHDAYHLDHRIERILHGLGFRDEDLKQEVASLSGGELNRLSLAKLLLAEPDIMLLDEPSNHLDLVATEWLEDFLKNTSAAVLLVSHDRYFLDRVTQRVFELYFGTIDEFMGNFSAYTRQKEERLLVQTRTYEKWVEEVEKTKDFIRRNHYGMKAAQAEDRRKKLERLEEEPASLPRKIDTPPMRFPKASRTGDIVFRIKDLSKGYGTLLFHNLTLDIERGQRWAILGPNGCGKTTLLKCLLGLLEPDSGTIEHGQGIKIGYFDQQLHCLDSGMRVVDAIRPPNRIFEEPQRRALLGSFGLTGDQQLQPVGSLSGGERCRAALAKLSAEEANVLILDEPTNHLDLWARAALERAARDFDGTVIFISHDRFFVDQVADHLLIIQPDATFRVLEGNYQTFRMMVSRGLIADPFSTSNFSATPAKTPQTAKPTQQPTPTKKESAKKDSSRDASQAKPRDAKKKVPVPKSPRKFAYRKVSDIEEEVFARETRVMSLNEDLLAPHVVRDGEKMRAIQIELDEENAKLQELYAHWEEATAR